MSLSAVFGIDMFPLASQWMDYGMDFLQRSVLFTDVLRQRGDNYLDHLRAGQPPVLVFDYEKVLDGRTLARPVNYCLIRILDRRRDDHSDPSQPVRERRRVAKAQKAVKVPRPVIIIDPRAGHGPGIGGFKRDSEIGIALDDGHPVYFVMFYTEPEPGQTIADIQAAEIRFIEEVTALHPDAPKPAIIGNCQAGWAAALIAGDRPDIIGPLVFNGAPLSYWAGVEGKNPMRYRGGLLGGVWAASWLSDLGNGKFDGAHLVAGFEALNPANTYWGKLYHLWANVDREASRFLEFERWWNGFYLMTAEEIHFIVSNLFVGDKLARGEISLAPERNVNLKRIQSPVVVFASSGDNITPPQQALNWICQVWSSADEIRQRGQTIVYLLHETIGHLGIFVAGSVARREHKGIIGILDLVDLLQPGLYEMVIQTDGKKQQVAFHERTFGDILKLDDGREDEAPFPVVDAVSRLNDRGYRTFVRPFLRSLISEPLAHWLRQMHPSRTAVYGFASANPAMWPMAPMAKTVQANRLSLADDNFYLQLEKSVSRSIQIGWDWFRDSRDLCQEHLFKLTFDHPLAHAWRQMVEPAEKTAPAPSLPEDENPPAVLRFEKGGVRGALIRIMLFISSADDAIDKKELAALEVLKNSYLPLARISRPLLQKIIAEQSRLVSADPQKALAALPKMIRKPKDRDAAVEIAKCMAIADARLESGEEKLLKQIVKLLEPQM